jgi:DNA-binding NtrC family response regulator
MTSPSDNQETRTVVVNHGEAPAFLLIIDKSGSRSLPLPPHGRLAFGRSEDCDVRVNDTSVSRRHAAVEVAGNGIYVEDLGSHNGTTVNGLVIDERRRLRTGDLIGLGEVNVFFRTAAPQSARLIHSRAGFVARLDDELERACRFDRPLGMLVLAGLGGEDVFEAALARRLRPSDFCCSVDEELWVALPEAEAVDGEALAEAMVAGTSGRAGLAVAPSDGATSDTLIEGAQAACASADAGHVVRSAGSESRRQLGDATIVVADAAMKRIYALLDRLAAADIAVLVAGETGVGKEHAAFAIHAASPWAQGPFIRWNCAALQHSLIESELFGHAKGAFSGATNDKAGLLEAAAGGTLFLDEVGELSAPAQAKLLRALETRYVTRVGETAERKVDFRVVSATNRDLLAEVEAGRFRRDLYFRLTAATVMIPPLRSRTSELPPLANLFVAQLRSKSGRPPMVVSDEAMRVLLTYDWPGNIRELRNAIEYATATAGSDRIERWHLPRTVTDGETVATTTNEPTDASEPAMEFRPVAEELQELEKRRMIEALDATGGVQYRAAALISMPKRTFTLKMRRYGLKSR